MMNNSLIKNIRNVFRHINQICVLSNLRKAIKVSIQHDYLYFIEIMKKLTVKITFSYFNWSDLTPFILFLEELVLRYKRLCAPSAAALVIVYLNSALLNRDR